MEDIHYLKVNFPLTKDNSPAIYDFLRQHLCSVLKDLGLKEASVEIERLEPLDKIYTNLDKSEEELKKIFDDFAKSHHFIEKPALTFEKQKTSLKAKLKSENICHVLDDYNTLFDIFFTDTIIKADGKLTIDMMDGFSNSVLVMGEGPLLEKFKLCLTKKIPGTIFEYIDKRDGYRRSKS